ncbi:MAG: response regulator [Acidobacteria bacterium]|nr:MAG: response regulator [Acidobacteriota bacterium]
MLRVVIADDHPVVLRGLKEILSEGFDAAIIDLASTGYELMNNVQKNQYDLVLLDISLPDLNGLEILKEIRKKKPKLPVLIISMYPEEEYALRAIKAGAQGYLTKRSASDELVLAVRIPVPEPGTHQAFYKVGTRRAQSIAKVSLAACARVDSARVLRHVRFAAGSVAATPVLLRASQLAAEECLLRPELASRVGDAAAGEVTPIDDVRSTAAYRRIVLGRLVARFLRELAEKQHG